MDCYLVRNTPFLFTIACNYCVRCLLLLFFCCAGLLQSHDATVAQSSLEVLMTLLGLAKTQDISRRLLQKTVQSVIFYIHLDLTDDVELLLQYVHQMLLY